MGLHETKELTAFPMGRVSEFGLGVRARPSLPSASAARAEASRSFYVRYGFKRLFDIVVALSVLAVIFPILPLIMLVLLIQDGPSMIFSQARVGIDNSRFKCLKFRSMALDAEKRLSELLETCSASRAEWEMSQKLRSDPRIHRVGHILRKSSLDEIPQLFNVLRGDMSIVGPRPMLPEQISLYGDSISAYSSVRPGITGLWQVSGRNTLNFDQRVALDCRYSENVTFWGDVKILARTVIVVLMGHGSC